MSVQRHSRLRFRRAPLLLHGAGRFHWDSVSEPWIIGGTRRQLLENQQWNRQRTGWLLVDVGQGRASLLLRTCLRMSPTELNFGCKLNLVSYDVISALWMRSFDPRLLRNVNDSLLQEWAERRRTGLVTTFELDGRANLRYIVHDVGDRHSIQVYLATHFF